MIKSINELTPPNLGTMPLVADVQAYEPYGSAALNRQMRGVLSKGVYSGFSVIPSDGLKVCVSSAGVDSAAAVEVSDKWLITVRQQSDVVLNVPVGRLSSVVLKAFYDGRTITNQVDVDSTVKAAELLVVNAGSEPSDSLILCQINAPSNASSITAEMISYDKRDRVSLEGFWNKLDSEHIAPKGQWFRTILNKGIKPSLDNVRAAAVDTIGTPASWFQEVWANKYRGGSVDVEGTIRSGGKLAMLQGDFGIGSTSKLLAANSDLNSLPLENGKYRGTGLLNTPEGAAASSGWWFVDHESHSLEHQMQRAIKYAATGHYGVWYRVKLNNAWAAWDCLYSVNNKPTKSDIGLSNVANERQYSSQNNNIGSGATNYAAGNHNHDDTYSKLGHKHVWSDITDPPIYSTRWPTLAEIGAQPAGSYAAASHTHPWSQITGAPVYTTRWPTWDEVSGKPSTIPPSSHTHSWSEITGAPVYTTRWPTLAEIGAQPAGSYAAASHTHPWSQVTGAPVYTTRWPTWSEVSGKPSSMPADPHDHHYLRGVYVSGGLENPDYFGSSVLKLQMLSGSKGGVPNVWSDALWLSSYSGGDVKSSNVLLFSKSGAARIGFRQQNYDSSVWGEFNEIYHTNRKPTPSEIGAALAAHNHASISTNYTNWVGNSEGAIVGGLTWRNYGNNHVVFDASKGITPAGTACDNADPANGWSRSYPTLMGFNGAQTYGVRVDSARNADSVGWLGVHTDRNNEANKVVRTDNNGYIQAGWINTVSGATSGATLFACFQNTSDMYIRYMNASQTREAIGAQPAGSYAAASHTHPWSQVTGAPVYTTRWPTWDEISGKPASATRWPTAAEIGAMPAPYTGTDAMLTNYPVGTYLISTGYKQVGVARNSVKPLYISINGGYSNALVSSNNMSGDANFRALSGSWAARGFDSVDGGSAFSWHDIVLWQRVA